MPEAPEGASRFRLEIVFVDAGQREHRVADPCKAVRKLAAVLRPACTAAGRGKQARRYPERGL
jgi:hypothetical protein